MKKTIKFLTVCGVLFMVWFAGSLLADKQQLHDQVIRLHVVANSDSEADQSVKLQVKDAIVAYLEPKMLAASCSEDAQQMIETALDEIASVANSELIKLGKYPNTQVSFCEEAYDVRAYETFTLPSGIYRSLRVELGNGAGKNWWCVVFPTLCAPQNTTDMKTVAAVSGFSDSLSATLAEENGYEIRFYFLDLLGKLEKMLFK